MTLDYLIIGAGPSGLMIHSELAKIQNGIVLESGEEVQTKKDDIYTKYQIKNAYRFSGLNLLIGRPPLLLSEGQAIGGGSAVNSSLHHRTPKHIWAKWKTYYGLRGFNPSHIDKMYDEIESMYKLSTSKNDLPPFYKYASEIYKVETIPRWGDQLDKNFIRRTALDLMNDVNPSLINSILSRHHVTDLKQNSSGYFSVKGIIKSKFSSAKNSKKQFFSFTSKKLFICAGAGVTPILLSKLGYRHKNLGKFQVHPTARISLLPKDSYSYNEIVEPFQITEFFPYIMIGSSANRDYLSKSNFPFFDSKDIDFNSCMNLYSMAPSEKKGKIYLNKPLRGLRTYFLSREAKLNIKKGIEIILDIARKSNQFSHAFSSSGIIPIEYDNKTKINKFISNSINSTLSSVHIFSSAAAGDNKKVCPINSDGSVPGIPNVYVMDQSILPTCPTVNPQATTCVFALSLIRKYIKKITK